MAKSQCWISPKSVAKRKVVVDEPLDNSEENVAKIVDENNVKIDVNESDVK